MQKSTKYALGLGLAALLGGAAIAAFGAPDTPHQPLAHELGPSKLFEQFDLNHDGKITQDEINKVLSARFAAASGGGSTLSQLQFANMRLDEVRKHSDLMFKRLDWNNNGKLSREEFLTAEHARFNRMDRRASGEVSCASYAHAAKADDAKDAGESPPHRHPEFRRARGMGFCSQYDTNKDGKVTRAEFDAALNKQFDQAAKGGGISPDGFYAMIAKKVSDARTRRFGWLDTNHDGKLTLDEFEAPQKKMFAWLDANHDGAITMDEVMAAMHHRFGRDGLRANDRNKDRKPGEQSPG